MIKKIWAIILMSNLLFTSNIFPSAAAKATGTSSPKKQYCELSSLRSVAPAATASNSIATVPQLKDPRKDPRWKQFEKNFEKPSFTIFNTQYSRHSKFSKAKLKEHDWLP